MKTIELYSNHKLSFLTTFSNKFQTTFAIPIVNSIKLEVTQKGDLKMTKTSIVAEAGKGLGKHVAKLFSQIGLRVIWMVPNGKALGVAPEFARYLINN